MNYRVALLALLASPLFACSLDTGLLPPQDGGPLDSGSDSGDVGMEDSGADSGAEDSGSADGGDAAMDSGVGDTGSGDSGTDAADTGADAGRDCTMWRTPHFDPCALGAPNARIRLSENSVFDTTTGTLTVGGIETPVVSELLDQAGTLARLLVVESLQIDEGARLRVVGAHPLILGAWSTIEIDGEISVGSDGDGRRGPGADHASCAGATSGGDGDSGTGGGGGGGFGGAGGRGGRADANGLNLPGGDGGPAVGAPTIVRGGCPGAASGQAFGTTRADGGAGGGAIQLSAVTRVRVRGAVLAHGAGGRGAPNSSGCGGGGGGSGGYIGLDALQVVAAGTLAANGGGGGGATDLSRTGSPGEDGLPNANRAAGGGGTGSGTDGARGGAQAFVGGANVSGIENGGGGGGGGAAGYVSIWTDMFSAPGIISPPETVSPLP